MRTLPILLLLACGSEPKTEALLRVGVSSVDFGQVPVGRNHTRRIAVRNAGAKLLQIEAVTIDRGPFVVFPTAVGIGPLDSAELRIRFEPESAGRFEGTMAFESNDSKGSTVTVDLIGVGACSGIGCAADAGTTDASAGDAEPGADAAEDAGVAPDAETMDAMPIDAGFDAGTAGLAASYRFEETSGALIDGSGNGNDGVPSSAGLVRGVAGKVGSAVQYDGSVGQFVVPADASLDGINALTIALWINTHDIGANQTILARGLNLGADSLVLVTQCNNIYVAFSRSGVTGTANATTNCGSFPADQWVHVAVVNDGLFLRVYLDGQQAAESMGGFLGAIGAPLYLGRREPGVEPFTGLMDELSWWTIALTPDEICGSAGGTYAGGTCTLP